MKMVEKSSCLFLYYTAVPDMSNSVTSTPTSSDVASVISVTCSNSCSNKHILDTEEETPCVSHHPQKKLKANYFSSEKEGFSLGKADPVTPMIQSSCINITHKEKGERLENVEKDSVISGDTILQKEVAKSSSVHCKEVGKCFEFASDVATTKHQPDDGAVCQTSGRSSVACGTSTALVDSGSLRSTINRLSQGQSDRRCHISGVNSRSNIDLANCNPNNLPQGLIRSEPVTFEEARDGLMTALAYLETNHILPGTTFKFLKRHR
ncbi:hypothetical protein LSH36_309g02018 [Paralvinella palmiformis]|uniref:Uncharacterized protein n=1 Tax=Paralvinella palmiformis TaxID=53620 RepID=A0AAD9JH39_9ANNE|nr:hypothetical protein LSH36_309g02018 [Paralvinella palmiformis]